MWLSAHDRLDQEIFWMFNDDGDDDDDDDDHINLRLDLFKKKPP